MNSRTEQEYLQVLTHESLPDDHSPAHAPPDDQSAPLPDAPSSPPAPASLIHIYIFCIANFGISAAWALEFATVTPYFETVLNTSSTFSHAVWVVGPLSGLIVAPIVGALTDTCTSPFGRRRPFIVVGLVATVIGMLLFSHAVEIAALLFPTSDHHASICARLIAVLAFCLLDLALNTTMWPVRALQGDLLPANEQHRVQSAAVVMGSLGDLAASAMLNAFDQPVSHIRICYMLAALVFTASVLVLVVTAKEKPIEPSEIPANNPRSFNILSYLRALPPWMWRIGLTYSLGFFTIFCVWPNASTWIGSSVLQGKANAPKGSPEQMRYERGVKITGQAGQWRALTQVIFSAVYPLLLNYISPGNLMGIAFGVFGLLLAVGSGTNSVLFAQIIVTVFGLPMSAHFTVPTGLTVEYSDASNRGGYLGALNCFAVIPQLIDTSYTGWVSNTFGEASVMRIGAMWGILTAISAFFYMKFDKVAEKTSNDVSDEIGSL